MTMLGIASTSDAASRKPLPITSLNLIASV